LTSVINCADNVYYVTVGLGAIGGVYRTNSWVLGSAMLAFSLSLGCTRLNSKFQNAGLEFVPRLRPPERQIPGACLGGGVGGVELDVLLQQGLIGADHTAAVDKGGRGAGYIEGVAFRHALAH